MMLLLLLLPFLLPQPSTAVVVLKGEELNETQLLAWKRHYVTENPNKHPEGWLLPAEVTFENDHVTVVEWNKELKLNMSKLFVSTYPRGMTEAEKEAFKNKASSEEERKGKKDVVKTYGFHPPGEYFVCLYRAEQTHTTTGNVAGVPLIYAKYDSPVAGGAGPPMNRYCLYYMHPVVTGDAEVILRESFGLEFLIEVLREGGAGAEVVALTDEKDVKYAEKVESAVGKILSGQLADPGFAQYNVMPVNGRSSVGLHLFFFQHAAPATHVAAVQQSATGPTE